VSERTITPEDAAAVARLPMVTQVAPHQDMESLIVSAGRHQTTTRRVGVTRAFVRNYNQRAAAGRLISSADVDFGRSVVVLGQVARQRLFPGVPAIGGTVRVGSHEFEVVGISLVTRVLIGGRNTKSLGVRVRSEADIEPGQDAITSLCAAVTIAAVVPRRLLHRGSGEHPQGASGS
jgi:hypothetical protein